MAMDQSALLDLLAQLKLTDVTDRIRVATETLYQVLIRLHARHRGASRLLQTTLKLPSADFKKQHYEPSTIVFSAGLGLAGLLVRVGIFQRCVAL